MQPPIWKKFVNVSGFAERNRSAIADENRRLREEESAGPRAKSGIGTVRFDLGGGVYDERDAEELEDDPVYGGIATEALFKRELKNWRDQADALDIELSDPSKPRKLTESQRAEILAEGAGLGEDNPRHAELKKALMTDEEIQAKEKAKWEAKKRLQELGQMGVNGFRQQRVQSRLSEAAKASQALAEQEQTIAAREAEGVKGRDLEAHAQEKAQVMQQKQVVETQKQSAAGAILEEPNEEAKKLAEWQAMKPDQRLARKLQDSKLFSSITQSIGITSDKSLVRRSDGSWDTPAVVKQYDNQIFNAVKSGLTAVRAKVGMRGGGTADETQAMNEALYQFQQENNLSDEEVVRAWNDFTARNNESWQDDEKLRVLSDGEIILNASAPEILDRQKLSKVIESANAPAEQKARALENLEFTRKNVAEQRLMAYEAAGVGIESPSEYAARTGRGAGMLNDPDFILEYEKKVLGAEGEIAKKARGFAGDVVLGFNKLATTVLGAGAQLTNSEIVGQLAAAGSEGGQVVSQGKPDTGIVGAVVQETPSLAAMVVGAELLGVAGAAIGVGAKVMPWVSRAGSLAMAGGQSLGATYADERAQGKTHEEAEEVALRSGINTAIITGVFNALPGMAGFEKYTGGAPKKAADVTMREIFKSTSKQELAARVSKFARDKVLAGVSEGLEEGVDELTNAFINAEPDTNLSTAWQNAIEAAKVGALIGTAVDVVGSTGFGNREKINAAVVAAGGAEVTPEEERKLAEIAGEEIDPAAGSQHVLAMREIDEISADAPDLALRASGSLKIARGMPLEELTSEEITALGVDRTGKPLGGEIPAMVEMVNGRPILLDGAIRELETAAPSSKGLISMTEGEARQKFAKTKFTVTSKTGKAVEVEARNDQEAGEIAAKQFDLGDQVDTVTPLAATGGAAKGKTPTPIANTPAGAKPSQPVASQPPVTPGTTPPPSPAVAVVEKIRAKSKGMAKLITVSTDPATRVMATDAGITVNPDALMAEAVANGLDEKQAAEWVGNVIDEEVRHMAQFRAAESLHKKSKSKLSLEAWRSQHYGAVWNTEFVATGKAEIVRKLYGEEVFDQLPEWKKAMEGIRMMWQQNESQSQTETAKLWTRVSDAVIAELKAVLEVLKSLAKDDALSPSMKRELALLQKKLKELETAPEKPAAKPAAAAPQGPFTVGQRIEGTVHKDDAQFGGQKISGVIAQVTPSGTVLLVQADGIARPVRVLTADAKAVEVKTAKPKLKDGEVIDTIAGKMSYLEFEAKGYAPEQVTKDDWVNLMRSERRRLDQPEEGDRKNAPWADYEAYHRDQVEQAVKRGEEVDPEVLKDYPDLVKEMPSVDSDKTPDKKPESKPETPAAVSSLPAPTAQDWQDRTKFVGEHFAGPPNSVVIQPRDMDSNPIGEHIVLPLQDSMEATAEMVASGFTQAIGNGSWRESLVKVIGSDGKAVAQMKYDADSGKMLVAKQSDLESARAKMRQNQSTPPATTNPPEVSSEPVNDGLTPAERALRDALDGLFAAPLGSSYAANLPPDRIQPLINVAIKMIEDGKIDAQSLAESLDKIAESVGKPQSLRKYSYAIWQAFKMVDTTLEDPNWNVIYGDEEAGEPSILAEYPTVEFPVAKLKLSKDVPQFKGDANEEGVVEKLEGEYVRLGTGAILVWLRANGDFEVISGRHRFALAKDTGEKTIPAQIVREKDGFTRAMALTADAELNIRDGQGTVQDYANYFRASGITKGDAKEKGLLGRAKGRAGWTIGTEASQEVFDLHANKRISDSVAEAIASTAPNDAALQSVGLKTAMSGAKADMIRNVMMAAKGAAAERANAGAQGDLFGFDDSAMREMENQAKVATRQQKDIREQIASVQGAAKRPEQAAKMGVDVKDPEGVNKKIAELKAELARWENWPMHSDLVAITRGQIAAPAPALPPSKMDIKAADSKELFADDGGFALATETTLDGDKLAAEKAKADAAKEAADAAQGNLFGDVAPDRKKDALKDVFGDLVDGLEAAPLTPSYTTPIPADRMAKMVNAAGILMAEGVNSPEKLAAELSTMFDGKLKPFTQSIWFAMKMVGAEGVAEPDWAALYAPVATAPSDPAVAPNLDDPKYKKSDGSIDLGRYDADVDAWYQSQGQTGLAAITEEDRKKANQRGKIQEKIKRVEAEKKRESAKGGAYPPAIKMDRLRQLNGEIAALEAELDAIDNPPATTTPPPAADESLTYDQFSQKYTEAFNRANRYTPDEAGSQVYIEEMAKLADEYPEFMERFDAESDKVPANAPSSILTLAAVSEFFSKLKSGDVTADQVKATWEQFKNSKFELKKELAKMTMAQLARFQGMRKPANKSDAVNSAYNSLESRFNPTDSLSYMMSGDMKKAHADAMDAKVALWTDEMIAEKAGKKINQFSAGDTVRVEGKGPVFTVESIGDDGWVYLKNGMGSFTPEQASALLKPAKPGDDVDPNAPQGNLASYVKNDSSPLPETSVESTADIESFTPEQAASELAKRGITIEKGTTKTGKPVWEIKGKTFDVKDALKSLGAKWYNPKKSWSIYSDEDPTQKIANALAGKSAQGEVPQGSQDSARTSGNADEDLRLRELRERLDSNPDERGTRGDALSSVDASTAALIRRGLNFGMPQSVVDDQIEDVAMITRAFTASKPMFLLGNGAGTGKTFVLGGAIREMRSKGATSFVYVTMNTDLIEQIKKDLADFGIQDVKFHTYSEMSTKGIDMPKGSVLIFDEAHNVKNADSSRGGVAQNMMGNAKFTIFASATPFENPVEAAYVAGTGIFNQMGGHTEFAKAYGANVRKVKAYDKNGNQIEHEYVYWTAGKLEDGVAARQWFIRQGIMVTRPMKLPWEMVDSQFSKHSVDKKWVEIYNQLEQAYESAMAEYRDENGNILDARNNAMVSMHMINTIKRILEASKVDQGVKRAQEILDDGGNVVLFVETKADRWIGRYRASTLFDKKSTLYTYPQMRDMMRDWEMEAAIARKMGERPGPRPFAEPIMSIARAMHDAGIEYELPSVEQEIVEKLGGKDKVGIYTGSVTSAAASKDKAAFLAGQKKVIVATMAKGGTGLSLHDRVGDRPTSQINLNLPWKASGVDQVSARVARYGLQSKAYIEWLFADNIPFERSLAYRVGRRMRDMGAIVKGVDTKAANVLSDGFDFEGSVDVKQVAGEVAVEEADIFEQAERLEKSRRQRGDQSNGFFETPFTLSALMTVISGARGKLLEPSAGRGNLIRFAKDSNAVTSITMVEQRADNADYLEGAFVNDIDGTRNQSSKSVVIRGDFLEEADSLGQFDSIHMNPPFERKAGVGAQDVAHVMKAYDLLAEDGRMVAIMGEGAFFRSTKQEQEFRQWLNEVGAIVVKLPENAFKNSNTGVRARMVIIDRDADGGRTDINLEDMDADSLRSVAEAIPLRSSSDSLQAARLTSNNDIDSPAYLGLDLQPYERPAKPDDSASDRKQAEYVALTAFEQAAEKAGGSNIKFFTLRDNATTDEDGRNDTLRRGILSFVKSFEQAFGKTVVFFDSGKSVPYGLSFPVTPNFIAINVNAPASVTYLLGHELGHVIKSQDRKLYDAFQRDVLALAKGKEGYSEMIEKRGYAADKIDDEMFNDIIGNLFARDSRLWQELAAKDTTGAFTKIAATAVRIINKMINGLRKLNQRDTTELIEDELIAVRKNIAGMLNLYRERGNSNREIVYRENATPDASPKFLKASDYDSLFAAPLAPRSGTAAQDAEYLAAVKSGDMETAQRMVDEAARAAGYATKAYHGTNAPEFTEFTESPMFGAAWFFSENSEYPAERGKRLMSVRLKPGRQKRVKIPTNKPWSVPAYEKQIIDEAKNQGFDSVKLTAIPPLWMRTLLPLIGRVAEVTGYNEATVVFSPSQIKSADPVTYDDQGNVIPLSQRFNPASDSILYAASLNGMNPDRVKEAMAQQEEFGNAVKPPNRASMGDETTRKAVDVFDIEYEERRERETRKQWVEGGTERAKNSRKALIENAKANAYGEVGAVPLTPEDIVGTQIVIEQMVKEAGNDFDKLIEAGTLIQAYRKMRGDVARVLASGWDRLMKPEERNRRFLANAILTLPPKVAAQIARKQLTPEQSKIEIRRELQERLTKIEKALKEYGVTINEVLGKQVYVSLDKKNVVKDIMKDATKDEALAIRMHQQHADAAKIAKTCHMTVAEVEKLVKKVYDEAIQRMIEKARAGMTLETSGLQAATLLTEEQIMAEARRMVEVGLGISPTVHTPSTRALARKAKIKVESEPQRINWSRPEFTSGLLSYTFDSKDLAEIKRTSQALIDATAATAKVETLTGKKRQEAEAMLAKLESILAKYGSSVQQVVESGKPLESYRFDITDRVHVHLIANAIRSVDADAIDKGVEWYYFSMLSGLQTMMVNASSVVHGVFDATIGRGAEMILNAFLRNPMNASLGETKYILKAMGPMMSRARSNFAASFGAETPFFEQDILGVPPDLESVLEGHGMYHRTAISGNKGQFIRIPTRILLATDEFVKTINAMTEVGAMAYRICRAGDLKPGTKEFDDKMKELVNIPGSLAWQMAASKAYNRTFTNALPGQKDLATGKTRDTRTVGEVFGGIVGKTQGLLQSGPSDTMTAKLGKTLLRLMFFPFVKVPYNITALAMTYTPLSLIDIATLYAQSRGIKGKAEKQKAQAEVIERMSRVMIGGIVAGFILGAGEGDDDDLDKPLLITGSRPYKDTKKGVRELGQRMGLDAYSISWPLPNGRRGVFHYGRIEPIATVLATTIDTMRELKQAGRGRQDYGEAMTKAVSSFTNQLSDKTFLKGIGDAYKTVMGEQNMSKFVADKLAMAVPNLIKQPIRETDPYFRDKADTFGEELLSAIYPSGIREPKVDIYGEKSTKLGNSLTRIFDFTDAGTVAVRKVDEMLWRYQQKNPDASGIPTIASDKYTPVTGEGQKEMTEKQARMYRERAGQNLTNMLKSRTFNYENPTERDIDNLNKLIEAARKSAKTALKYDPNWK